VKKKYNEQCQALFCHVTMLIKQGLSTVYLKTPARVHEIMMKKLNIVKGLHLFIEKFRIF
jgi:hypothetical protein